MRPAAQEILRICGIAVLAGGLAAALALLFVPLPLQRTATSVGYCGPGLTADNAVQVRIDPGIVNTGGTAAEAGPPAEQQRFEQFCTGEADTRLTEAAATAVIALILGVGAMVLARRSGTAEFRPPMQPWAPGPQ